jgi:hypothetical protein
MNLTRKTWMDLWRIYSDITGSKYTSTFGAYSQVRNVVTDSAVVEFFKEIKKLELKKFLKKF